MTPQSMTEIDELRAENERLRGRVAELEAAMVKVSASAARMMALMLQAQPQQRRSDWLDHLTGWSLFGKILGR